MMQTLDSVLMDIGRNSSTDHDFSKLVRKIQPYLEDRKPNIEGEKYLFDDLKNTVYENYDQENEDTIVRILREYFVRMISPEEPKSPQIIRNEIDLKNSFPYLYPSQISKKKEDSKSMPLYGKRRVEFFLRRFNEKTKYVNPSRSFRENFFVDINQKINNIIFHDRGLEKTFREYSECFDERIDQFFPMFVSDPLKDYVVREFITNARKKFKKTVSEIGVNTGLVNKVIALVHEFYGGNLTPDIHQKYGKITSPESRSKNKSNIILLGDLKGCGVCIQRSILFKLLCDELGIGCRLLRGFLSVRTRGTLKKHPHVWNEVVIEGKTSLVDSTHFSEIVQSQYIGMYQPSGHPSGQNREDDEKMMEWVGGLNTIKGDIKRGGLHKVVLFRSLVFALCYPGEFATSESDTVERTKDLKRKILMLRLLQHENIVRFYGHFNEKSLNKLFRDVNDEKSWKIILKRYDMDGREFFHQLKQLNDRESDYLSAGEKTREILIFLSEISSGLRFIHSYGYVHLNLKPGKILLNVNNLMVNEVVINGFYSMHRMGEPVERDKILVTHQYASPEVMKIFKDRKNEIVPIPTAEMDIYSFGMIIIDCIDFLVDFPQFQRLASLCIDEDPSKRPKLSEIISVLKECLSYLLEHQEEKNNEIEVDEQQQQQSTVSVEKKEMERMRKTLELMEEVQKKQQEVIKIQENLSKTRIRKFVKFVGNEDRIRIDPSRHFRERMFVGFDHKIHDIIFHDSGRDKDFKHYQQHKKEQLLDPFVETTVCNRRKDKTLKEFLEKIEKGFKSELFHRELKNFQRRRGNNDKNNNNNYLNPKNEKKEIRVEDVLPKIVIQSVEGLMKLIAEFFGGVDFGKVDKLCDEFIKKEKETRNMIYLGEFKGRGVCRHRSIMFKIVCDLLGIRCSLQRGWVELTEDKKPDHCWTIIQLNDHFFQVELFGNLRLFYGVTRKGYVSLGGSVKDSLHDQEVNKSVENIRRDYNPSPDYEIGKGSISHVYEVETEICVEKTQTNKKKKKEVIMMKKTVAVKEYNTTLLTSTSGVNSRKAIEKEEMMMKLMKHENIIKYLGSFTRLSKRRRGRRGRKGRKSTPAPSTEYYCLCMEYLESTGSDFLDEMNLVQDDNISNNNNNSSVPFVEKNKNNKYGHNEKEESMRKLVEVLIFFIGILKGLRYLHSLGIIHFDLHIRNILVSWDDDMGYLDKVKVSDFGSCKEKLGYGTTAPHTHPEVLAPEILRMNQLNSQNQKMDRKFTSKSDIYSFGKIMEMFKKFFEGYSEIEGILVSCLAERPEDRPSTGEMIHVFLSHLGYIDDLFTKSRRIDIKILEQDIIECRNELKLLSSPQNKPEEENEGEESDE